VAALTAGGHDGIIAFGGGSSIDTAKAAALIAASGGAVRDHKAPLVNRQATMPVVAVPTTAGTGAEVTRFTVITDSASHEKMLLGGPALQPVAAIVDYELTFSLPRRTTADTGVDSLTHAIEAYVSRKAHALSDALAKEAMAAIVTHLPTAYEAPDDRPARSALMTAATLAGMAFSNASVALVHGMSRPIGAHFQVPHGLSNAMLLPAVTAYSLPGAPARYAEVARQCGFAAPETGDEAAGAALVAGLRELNRRLEVPTPHAYGIAAADWQALTATMADQALASGSPANNPRVPDRAAIIDLYGAVYTGT
jgi:alcohol dehydrogenase class IV